MKAELNVGDPLFYVEQKGEVIEVSINRIGRKYYYVKQYSREWAVSKDSLRYEDPKYSSQRTQYYRSKEEIVKQREMAEKRRRVMSFFNWSCRITDEDLEKVYEIVKAYLERSEN